MVQLNDVKVAGRLTRDPDLRYTPAGKAVCSFSLAVDRPRRNGDQNGNGRSEADFFDVVCWEGTAESVAQHLGKGSPVLVLGRLRLERWQTPEGENRQRVKIVAVPGGVQFLETKAAAEARRNGSGAGAGSNGAAAEDEGPPIDDDDVPF